MAAPTNRTFTGPAHGEAPWEFLQSVDVALLLILMLRDAGTITVTGAAQALGVSPSTAHRSLTMLVYRGFATRSESRTYLPGPALSSASPAPGMGNDLIQACSEHMHEIAKETGETCHLTVLSGANVHFLYSVEGTQPVRVGDRRGQVIPADQNSSGLSMLAELSHSELRVLYPQRQRSGVLRAAPHAAPLPHPRIRHQQRPVRARRLGGIGAAVQRPRRHPRRPRGGHPEFAVPHHSRALRPRADGARPQAQRGARTPPEPRPGATVSPTGRREANAGLPLFRIPEIL